MIGEMYPIEHDEIFNGIWDNLPHLPMLHFPGRIVPPQQEIPPLIAFAAYPPPPMPDPHRAIRPPWLGRDAQVGGDAVPAAPAGERLTFRRLQERLANERAANLRQPDEILNRMGVFRQAEQAMNAVGAAPEPVVRNRGARNANDGAARLADIHGQNLEAMQQEYLDERQRAQRMIEERVQALATRRADGGAGK
jgi:hypothetical protein